METERTTRKTTRPAKPATSPRRRRAKSTPEPEPTNDQIQEPTADDVARRAYEISLERAGLPGDPLSDWLQAERELKERLA